MIKQVYIMGKLNPETGESEDYTYTELAAIFNIKTDSQVRKQAEKDDWNTARDRQKKIDDDALKKKLQEMRAQELPDIVTMRRQLLKGQLAIVTKGLAKLEANDMEIKPLDLHRASEFIIDQYYILFGIEFEPEHDDEVDVEVKVNVNKGSKHDVLRRATRLISRANSPGSDDSED
jgi:hypothetical protein